MQDSSTPNPELGIPWLVEPKLRTHLCVGSRRYSSAAQHGVERISWDQTHSHEDSEHDEEQNWEHQ
jgi:hypothetical protein